MDVVEALRDGAVVEQHDAVGDADRHHLGIRCTAERLAAIDTRNAGAGENAQCPGSVAEIVDEAAGIVARVVGTVGVDEVLLKRRVEVLRARQMGRVISGIEMRDAGAVAVARVRGGCERRVPLGVFLIAVPEIVRQRRVAGVLLVGSRRRGSERDGDRTPDSRPTSHCCCRSRLGEVDWIATGDAEPIDSN